MLSIFSFIRFLKLILPIEGYELIDSLLFELYLLLLYVAYLEYVELIYHLTGTHFAEILAKFRDL